VDRTQVGTEDTFRLTVVVSGAPDNARVQLPSSDVLEVLSKSQGMQTSVQFGSSGSPEIRRSQQYTLVMRATRTGTLTIPAATVTVGRNTYKADPIKLEVTKGRVGSAAQRPDRFPDPFDDFGFPGFPDDNPFDIPRTESDLFLKATLDKQKVYVGEQVTLSVYIFSRVDLSSVDGVTMPKLDGFWSEDMDSPTQLSPEPKVINGVSYRSYLLKRKALFPVKPGDVAIDPVQADIAAGRLFATSRVRRRSNALALEVKPLPPGGPKNFSSANVGKWRLSTEVSQTQVALGQPVTLKVKLEGKGNLRHITPPPVQAPPTIKVYDPTTTDRASQSNAVWGGQKVQEYLLIAQQTGTFTLPGLTMTYFDPSTGRYEETRTDPITLTITPGQGGAPVGSNPAALDPSQKNKLEAGGLRPLRHRATFSQPGEPLWKRSFFLPLTAAPVLAWVGLGLIGWARRTRKGEDPEARKKRQAKAARARLSAAEKLLAQGSADAFYSEVERALHTFLEAKLGSPVVGLTRDSLAVMMKAKGVAEPKQRSVLHVLEACEVGRFAPGGASATSREGLLEQAADAMDGWPA
jgi:hypothetical protein